MATVPTDVLANYSREIVMNCIRSVLLLGLLLGLTACGGGGGGDAGPPQPPPVLNTWDQMAWDDGNWA